MVVSMRRRTLLRIAKKLPRCGPGLPHLPHALPLERAHVAEWFFAASDITRLYILDVAVSAGTLREGGAGNPRRCAIEQLGRRPGWRAPRPSPEVLWPGRRHPQTHDRLCADREPESACWDLPPDVLPVTPLRRSRQL